MRFLLCFGVMNNPRLQEVWNPSFLDLQVAKDEYCHFESVWNTAIDYGSKTQFLKTASLLFIRYSNEAGQIRVPLMHGWCKSRVSKNALFAQNFLREI